MLAAGALNPAITIDTSNRINLTSNETGQDDDVYHLLIWEFDRSITDGFVWSDNIPRTWTGTKLGSLAADHNATADLLLGARDIPASKLYCPMTADFLVQYDRLLTSQEKTDMFNGTKP